MSNQYPLHPVSARESLAWRYTTSMKAKSDISLSINYSKQKWLQAVNIHKLHVAGMKFWLTSWTEIKEKKVLVIQLCRTENLIVDLWHLVNWEKWDEYFVTFLPGVQSWLLRVSDLTSYSLFCKCIWISISI